MKTCETDYGKVFLVGAGPGDPGLITVRGTQCLALADLVLYDYLVNPRVLDYASPSAERVCLGHPHFGRTINQDEINRHMIEAAHQGRTVVRLKAGDPNLFGRGSEECDALAHEGIAVEVVPGVTAAVAASAYTGIPITHRKCASAVALITGHQRTGKSWAEFDYQSLAQFPGTLVFYMGMTTSRQWSEAMIRGGRSPETPVAIVRRATWPDQETKITTLSGVADMIEREGVRPPAVIIVGETVSLASQTCWFTDRPLFGVRILVPLEHESLVPWWDRLAELGADVVAPTTLKSADIDIRQQLADGQIDWTIVPDASVARSLVGSFGDALARTKLVSMESAATEALIACGIAPHAVAACATIEGVVAAILPPG